MTHQSQSAGPYRHSVSVAGAVINDNGSFLAIRRRDNGHWELPGGILELGETPEQGVIREVLEETGVTVEVDQLRGVYKNMSRGIVALVFRCRPAGGAPQPTAEASDVQWLTDDQVRDRVDEAYAVRFLDAKADGPVILRAHNGVNLVSAS